MRQFFDALAALQPICFVTHRITATVSAVMKPVSRK